MDTRDKLVSIPHLAGFFDGEGCVYCNFHLTKKSGKAEFSVNVMVVNTYLPKLECIQQSFGGHIRAMKTKPGNKQLYRIEWWGAKADNILRLLLTDPDFMIKRRQAEIGIAMRELKATARKPGTRHCGNKGYPPEIVDQLLRMRDEIRFLNRKGAIAVAETKPRASEVNEELIVHAGMKISERRVESLQSVSSTGENLAR